MSCNDSISQLNLSKEKVQRLMNLLNNQNLGNTLTSSSTSQVNIAGMDTYSTRSLISRIVDIGATDHIICDSSLFSDFRAVHKSFVSLPNSQKVQVRHIVNVHLNYVLIL